MPDITEEKLTARFASRIVETSRAFNELGFIIDKSALSEILQFLRDDPELQYLHLSDVTATDWPEREKRFEVVYHLYSFLLNRYLRFKIVVGENEQVPTLCGLWDTADWLEREVYDMFGVTFAGHPDLRRILMWEEFEGHPLRRDFPLTYEMPQFTFNKDEPPEVIK